MREKHVMTAVNVLGLHLKVVLLSKTDIDTRVCFMMNVF